MKNARLVLMAGILLFGAATPRAFADDKEFAPTSLPGSVRKVMPKGARTVEKTKIVGGEQGNKFTEEPGNNALLTGFAISVGDKDGLQVIKSLQGIYRTAQGRVLGVTYCKPQGAPVTVEARDGYAVGGVRLKAGEVVAGMEVTFMKIATDGRSLEPADSYTSQWLGGTGGELDGALGADGNPIVGITGRSSQEFNALGLLQSVPMQGAGGLGAATAMAGAGTTATKTDLGGDATAGDVYEDVQPAGFLVGFEVGLSPDERSIACVEPIFETPAGRSRGTTHGKAGGRSIVAEARPGYAVGAVHVGGSNDIKGIGIVFMKIDPGNRTLNKVDVYRQQWIGDMDQPRGKDLAGDGLPVVGIYGTAAARIRSLGLVQGVPPALAVQPGQPVPAPNSRTPDVSMATPAAPPSFPPIEAPKTSLRDLQNGLVFVQGATGKGSGFVCSLNGQKWLVTNAHVMAGVRTPTFKMFDRTAIQVGAAGMAVGHDIVRLAVSAGGTPIEVMKSVDNGAAIGDEVVVLGNAEGGDVVNTLEGKIVGIGPNLVEVTAEFQPGNSGSPIIHKKTGQVIGVATYAIVRKFDPLTGQPSAEPKVRRFGYRLDSVKSWQPINWAVFYQQAAEMEKIEGLTADLAAFLQNLVAAAKGQAKFDPGAYDNSAIRQPLERWVNIHKRGNQSQRDLDDADLRLIASLRSACQADVLEARRKMSYDYFYRGLEKEKQERDEIAQIFEKILKAKQVKPQ